MRAVKSSSAVGFLLCGTVWGLSLLSYSTARLMVLVMLVALAGCYFREIRRIGARVFIILVPIIFVLFLLWLWNRSNPGSLAARFQTISIWKDQADVLTIIARFLSRYLHYLSPAFLFVSGDPNLRHHTGNGGELFLFTFPALLAGLVSAWQSRQQPLERFVLSGFILFPLAASLTEDPSHSLRAVCGTPFMVVLTIWGFRSLWTMVERQRLLVAVSSSWRVWKFPYFTMTTFLITLTDPAYGSTPVQRRCYVEPLNIATRVCITRRACFATKS